MSDEIQDWQDGPLRVVKNLRGDLSIWPEDREIPAGWSDTGVTGNKQHCLDRITEMAGAADVGRQAE
jgi:MbtH protein